MAIVYLSQLSRLIISYINNSMHEICMRYSWGPKYMRFAWDIHEQIHIKYMRFAYPFYQCSHVILMYLLMYICFISVRYTLFTHNAHDINLTLFIHWYCMGILAVLHVYFVSVSRFERVASGHINLINHADVENLLREIFSDFFSRFPLWLFLCE